MNPILAVVTSLAAGGLVRAQDDGMPFGPINDADPDRFCEIPQEAQLRSKGGNGAILREE
jgi:hypothetical protein